MRVLLMEDESELNQSIVRQLVREGHTVDACFDGRETLDRLAGTRYDAAVLDVSMPEREGLGVLDMLRSAGNHTPVLMLTERDDIASAVENLDYYEDDFLVKPIEPSELAARLRVLLHRNTGERVTVFTCGDLTLDATHQSVTRDGKIIRLAAKEYDLLEYMIRHKGMVLSRERIESSLWNDKNLTGSNLVDVYIRMLRRKLDDGYERKLIHTIRGRGYTLKEMSA